VAELARRFLRPREGWTSMALLVVMVVVMAWSVQRAEWFERLDYLVPVAVLACLVGALLGLTRLSVAITLPISSILGAGFVLWTVGGEYFPELGNIHRLIVLRGDAVDWTRIVVDGGFAPQLTPYALALGVLMWTTSFIAAYALFRHHRVLDSILLVGVALLANMSATFTDLFAYLVVFSIAALLLWLRIALVNREENWRVRRVNENLDVPAQIMRSGFTFIAGSIALAWILTTVAVAAPLTSVWSNLDGIWSDVRNSFEGAFGGLAGADSRIQGTSFGSAFRVHGKWTSSDSPVMTVASSRPYYMRTVTYDVYTGNGWDSSEGSDRRVDAGARIFPAYTPERIQTEAAFSVETVEIEVQGNVGRNVFAPGYPTTAGLPLIVHEPGGLPLLGALQSGVVLTEGKGYHITAAISKATEAMLAGAGQAYPPEIVATYLAIPGVTQRTAVEARRVVDAAGATDPYHEARALADYLRSDRFTYSTVAALPSDPGQDIVDFFLFDPNGQSGYCEFFATTMAVMARTLGLPARVAVGYAPGERIDDGIFQVRAKNAHAWAEIFFPGYGWQIFEATKSISPVVRLSGSGIVPPVNPAVGGVDPGQQFKEGDDLGGISTLPSFQPVEGGFKPGDQRPTDKARDGNAWVVVVLLMLLLATVAFRLLRGRYRFRFLAPGDRQWQRLAFAADRAGVAQRPSETVYEYAGWLQEQLPRRTVEIHEIADGKVWQSYSGHSISSDAIARLERAWARLQLPLLWLAVRSRVRTLFGRR
jgi:transglutaminase-like putative cysteine protease